MISYILYRTASILAGSLPQALCMRIAAVVAFIFFAFKPAIRKNVRTNFEKLGMRPKSTFPVFRNFSRAVTDLLRLSHMSRDELMALCRTHGTDNLDRALNKGKGAILFAPHLGPWDLAGACLSCLDRSFSRRGMRLRFFDTDTLLPDGHITLSLRSGAALVPCCSWYAPDGRIEIAFGEEIRIPDSGDFRPAIGQACVERIEEFVRSHPEQWFAFDHLWEGERHV
ncbi:MAG: lysophospholipid acyltransferase family protein [Candidatus Krumholzibacteria bacterium]|nr:lysophospholipid acyltransferase family protein [Candidatus Krumholzibacteria bacterium]